MRRSADYLLVLLATLLTGVALAVPGADVDRYNPVPPTTLTLTIPMTPGTNAFGDRFTYRWDTAVYGPDRCQPGALPDLTNVAAGTVIDAPLPRPPKSWCRGPFGVELQAVVEFKTPTPTSSAPSAGTR